MSPASISIEVQAERLRDALQTAPKRLRAELATTLLKVGVAHEHALKRRFRAYTGDSGDGIQKRSGGLMQAYHLTRPHPDSLEVVPHIRKGMRGSHYARMQEFGGTVRPKRAKYLTVPLPAALTKAGVLSGRYKIRPDGRGGFTTDAGDTFLFKSRRGALLIGIKDRKTGRASAQGRGKKRELKPFYVLKKSVTLRPRLGFFGTWELLERRTLPALLQRSADRAIKDGGRA